MGSARVSSNLTGVDFLTFAVFKMRKIHPPGIEPGTYRVLGGRHNQLDHSCLSALSRIRTGVVAATKRSTNHYTNSALGDRYLPGEKKRMS